MSCVPFRRGVPWPRALRQLVHLAARRDVGEPEFIREGDHEFVAANGEFGGDAFNSAVFGSASRSRLPRADSCAGASLPKRSRMRSG